MGGGGGSQVLGPGGEAGFLEGRRGRGEGRGEGGGEGRGEEGVSGAWAYGEDVPGKPGWLFLDLPAETSALQPAPSEISFEVIPPTDRHDASAAASDLVLTGCARQRTPVADESCPSTRKGTLAERIVRRRATQVLPNATALCAPEKGAQLEVEFLRSYDPRMAVAEVSVRRVRRWGALASGGAAGAGAAAGGGGSDVAAVGSLDARWALPGSVPFFERLSVALLPPGRGPLEVRFAMRPRGGAVGPPSAASATAGREAPGRKFKLMSLKICCG